MTCVFGVEVPSFFFFYRFFIGCSAMVSLLASGWLVPFFDDDSLCLSGHCSFVTVEMAGGLQPPSALWHSTLSHVHSKVNFKGPLALPCRSPLRNGLELF